MAFYTYIYAPKQTQLSWVWDLLVITNSTKISREYEISGLSLSLSLMLKAIDVKPKSTSNIQLLCEHPFICIL